MPEIFLAVAVVLLLFLALRPLRVVNEYDRLVIFRLGRTDEQLVKGPGLIFLIPFVDRPRPVGLAGSSWGYRSRHSFHLPAEACFSARGKASASVESSFSGLS